jgi:hypothetical protein
MSQLWRFKKAKGAGKLLLSLAMHSFVTGTQAWSNS